MRRLHNKQWYISIGTSSLIVIIIAGYFASHILNRSAVTFEQLKQQAQQYSVDFDTSMSINDYASLVSRADNQYVLDLFRSLYNRNAPAYITPSLAYKIPPYIHIMWLGGQLPQEYESYVKSWRTFHPDWVIVFWTDSDLNYSQGDCIVHDFESLQPILKEKQHLSVVVDTRQLQFDNRIFYDQAINYGERSDILKWEIVYRFGGVWVDTDFECLRSLDLFHHLYDFYTGIQPLDTNLAQLGAALFAARPHHPILERCVKTIKNNQDIKQIIVKTGPIHFTKAFIAVAGKSEGLIDIALPASYFYPCGYEQRGMEKQLWCKSESFAVHHWAGSWLKPQAFTHG